MKSFKYFIPAIIWMLIIFLESAMTGEVSSGQSHFIVDLLFSIFSIPLQYHDFISFLIRKCAHITEYAILTFLLFYGLHKNDYSYLILPAILAFIYSCGDEIHQLSVNGRAGQFQDVIIDSIGIIISIIILYFLRKFKNNAIK